MNFAVSDSLECFDTESVKKGSRMSRKREEKNRITVYLIKPDYSIDQIGKDGLKRQEITGVGVLLSKQSVESTPRWADKFFKGKIDKSIFRVASASAVLILELKDDNGIEAPRLFAITFGHGRHLLNDNVFEESFGLKTVLNSIEADSVRKIAKTSVGGNQKASSEQMPLKSTISEFSLDIDRDLLSSITAVGNDDELFAGALSGGDSFSLTAAVDVYSIREFCVKIYNIYNTDKYVENFGWIDHIKPVKDKKLIAELNANLVQAVNSGSKDIWMAVPEIVDWENIQGFVYPSIKTPVDDIIIDDVIAGLREPLSDFGQLEKTTIQMIGAEDGETLGSWHANKCLFGELLFKGDQFCINNGKWYCISKDFAKKIDDDYQETVVSSFPFVDYHSGLSNESDYNEYLANQNPNEYLLMDKKNVLYGGGYSRIELCDVLTLDGKLVHIKSYSGSFTLSHLFNQGLVSAELLKSDKGFLNQANDSIEKIRMDSSFCLSANSGFEVVFGIISKEMDDLPNIPFFSRVSFYYVKSQLSLIGIPVSIKAIHKVAVE